jgi:glycosyltransferase involved in cell wall biosynthesis
VGKDGRLIRVAVNSRFLAASSLRGINRYTANLLAELSRLDVNLILLSDRPIHPSHLARLREGSFVECVSPPMRYWKWEQFWQPAEAARLQADILHCPCNFGLPWSAQCPTVLTLHDAIDKAYYAPQAGLRQKLTPDAMKIAFHHWVARTRCDRIITVSRHAKADIARHHRVAPGKIQVIYPGVEEKFFQAPGDEMLARVRHKYRLPDRFVFYVGGFEQRKNVGFLVRSFAGARLADVDLVLGGGTDAERASLASLAASLGIEDQVHFTGWIDDEDLPAMYRSAECFVYPSEYEGFGLQILEALASGCPVIASDSTSLPEVVGNAGELYDSGNADSLAEKLRKAHARETHIDAGRARERARSFTWLRMADETRSLYAEVIRRNGR